MSECIFCAIVRGDAPSFRLHEDDDTVAFLDIHPFTRGHTLVIPRRHASHLLTISPDDATAVMRTVHRVAAVLHERLRPDGLNLVQATGAAAWQTVDHFHVHIIPRYSGDGLELPWRPSPPEPDGLRRVHEAIVAP